MMKLTLFASVLAAVGVTAFMATKDSGTKKLTKEKKTQVTVERTSVPETTLVNEPVEPVVIKKNLIANNISETAAQSEPAPQIVTPSKPITKNSITRNKVKAKPKAKTPKVSIPKANKKAAQAKTAVATDSVSTQQAAADNGAAQLNGNLQNLMGGNTRSRFRGTVEFGLNTDLKSFDDPSKATGTSLFFRPRYQLNSKYTALLNAWVDKGISQGFEDRLNDLRVGVFRNPLKYGKLLVIPNVIATLPTSEESKRNQDMIMGLEFNPNLVYLQNDLLNFFFTPRIRRNFHEFTTSRTNQVNVEYTFMGIAGFSYNFTDRFSFQPALIYIQNRTYEGTDRDPSYLTALEGRYQIDRKTYALIGTMTGGGIFATERGPDQNIELFNENTTSIYANYGFLF